MEYVKKDDVIRVIKSGCKLNSIINILTKDIVEKVNALPTVKDIDVTKDRTKEGLTREECADLQLVGAEIVHFGCESCSHSMNGKPCNYYDTYKDKLILNGQCTGWKGRKNV